MKVLVACEYSGVVRDAFAARGHRAVSCDLLDTERPDGLHIKWDAILTSYFEDHWDLLVAHPPCTRLTNSGVRWLHVPPKGKTLDQMWDELDKGVAFYKRLREAPIPLKAIENPVMHPYARERIEIGPRQVVQPWWFGDPFFKATGLELIGLPKLTATKKLTPPKAGTEEHKRWSAVHRESPGPDRAKNRSRFFPGMADAMADQWGALDLII